MNILKTSKSKVKCIIKETIPHLLFSSKQKASFPGSDYPPLNIRNTVIAKPAGGLANQIITYRAGVLVASRKNAALIIDASNYANLKPSDNRVFQLLHLNLDYNLLNFDPGLADRLLEASDCHICQESVNGLKDVEEHPLLERLEKADTVWIDIWGGMFLRTLANRHFQRSDVPTLFPDCFESALGLPDIEVLKMIRASSDPVAIHVRRGDFATHNGGILISMDFYNRAIVQIGAQIKHPDFFVFSDDIPWCRENIRSEHTSVCFVDHNDERAGYRDLYLASRCRHFILSHCSTFSKQLPLLSNEEPGRRIIWSEPSDFE